MSQNDSKEKKYILKASDDPKKIDSNFSNKSAAETVKNNINIFSNKNISHDLNTDNKNENNKLYKCLSDGNPRNNNNTIINDFKKQYDPDNSFCSDDENINVGENNNANNNNHFFSSEYSKNNSFSNQNKDTQIDYFKNDKSITKTRLSDMGNKSYLNAVLQCIGNIKNLEKYFIDMLQIEKFNSISLNNIRLSFTFHRLFIHLNEGNQTYKPESLLSILQEKNIIFKRKKTELNPKLCLNFILNQLHDELNHKKDNNFSQSFNQYNDEEVIKICKNIYENNNSSIISNLFNWYELKDIRCNECGTRKYQLQDFFTFELPLSDYYNLKKKNRNSLIDCLDFAFSSKPIKNIFCEKCKKLSKSESLINLINTPEIFAFVIDRGDFDTNLMNINFLINEKINLKKYLYYDHPMTNYELISIVSIYNNKYISFIKDEKDKNWYAFHDSNASKLEIYDIINSIKHIPCILFYKLIKNN